MDPALRLDHLGRRFLLIPPDPLGLGDPPDPLIHLDQEDLEDLLDQSNLLDLLLLVRRQPLTDPMDLPDQ